MDELRLRAIASRDNSSLYDAVLGVLKGVWTSLPAIISEDSDGHVATAQSAVKQIVTAIDGSTTTVPFPDFQTSPVHYPGGGGVSHTHPVKKGDEGVIHFLSMPQDLWHQKGGIQDPVDGRRHHLSDSRWEPGGRSDPRKLDPAPSTSSQQNRSDDGKHVFDTHPQNGLTAASSVKHLTQVGGSGSGGAGTLHLPAKILKNAAKVLINCIQQDPLPPPGDSLANRKQIATKPIGAGAAGSQGGGIASIMSGVLSGGAGAMFANPLSSAGGGLSSAITSAVSSLSGVSGASGLIAALSSGGGLSSALSGLMSGASGMSGATTPTGGNFGLSDVLSHAASLSDFFGSSTVPTSVSLSAVLAPLQSGPTLTAITGQIGPLISTVIAGTVTPGTAAVTVSGWTSQLSAIMSSANSAMTTLNAAAPVMNLALAAAGAGAGLDPHEQAVAGAISNPNLAMLTSAVNAIFSLSASDTASAQAFPDASATQAGATGGMT